ncbi:MAG: ATP-binding cassette domain-containing protein [Desulfobacterales bacterium]|nr:ATP-binding cassette domain-containing protein [Desulfobacterales bacterium]
MMLLLTNLSMALVLFFGGRQTILLRDHAGGFRGLHQLPRPAHLADDGAGLGHQPDPARPRVAGAGPRASWTPARHPRRRRRPSRWATPRGEIVFEAVGFTYPGAGAQPRGGAARHRPADRARRSVLGIVGPPGSGKTTLLSLIPRLYDPAAGRIRLDGLRRSARLRIEDLRRPIACMPQEPFLFAGTIRDNITFGDPGVADERLTEAARGRRPARHRAACSRRASTRWSANGA